MILAHGDIAATAWELQEVWDDLAHQQSLKNAVIPDEKTLNAIAQAVETLLTIEARMWERNRRDQEQH